MHGLDVTPLVSRPRPSEEVVYERTPRHLLEQFSARYSGLVGPLKNLESDQLLMVGVMASFVLFVLSVALYLVLIAGALGAPVLAWWMLWELLPNYRRTPRRIIRDERELVGVPDRFGDDEVKIRFEDVRRVYPSDDALVIRYRDGREDRLAWLLAARRAVLSVLEEAVMLQPHGGEPGAMVPLLHVPPDERDLIGLALPTGDADCPACGRHMPSQHWFAIDRARRRVVCIDCAREPISPPAPEPERLPDAVTEG